MTPPASNAGGAPSHYSVLGIGRTASAEEIRTAYRRRARQAHPDYGGSSELFLALTEAYRVLGDPALRRRYDAGLPAREGVTTSRTQPARDVRSTHTVPSPLAGNDALSRSAHPVAGFEFGTPIPLPSNTDGGALLSQASFGTPSAPRGFAALRKGAAQAHRAKLTTQVFLGTQLLPKYPAARLFTELHLDGSRGPGIDHVLLGGDRVAVLASVPAPFEALNYDHEAVFSGGNRASYERLVANMMDVSLAFPHYTVQGWAIINNFSGNPFSPALTDLRTAEQRQVQESSLAPSSVVNPGGALRELALFFAAGKYPNEVSEEVVERLRGALV